MHLSTGEGVRIVETTVPLEKVRQPKALFLPRMQLFEFCDQDWFAGKIRSSFLRVLNLTSLLMCSDRSITAAFLSWVTYHEKQVVMDLASGGGGHLSAICKEIDDTETVIILSDLFPQREMYEKMAREHPSSIDACEQPVELMSAVNSLRTPQLMSLFNSLHHLQEQEVAGILDSAIRNEKSLFIVEMVDRNWLHMLTIAPFGFALALLYPLMAKRFGLDTSCSDCVFCSLIPIVPVAFAFDGFVSCLRAYTFEELERLVPEGDHAYTLCSYQVKAFGVFPIRVYTFYKREILIEEFRNNK